MKRGPGVLLPVIGKMRAELDENLARYTAASAESGDPVSCATCTRHGCCKQRVLANLVDGIAIAGELVASGRDTPALRKRLRAAADAMEGKSNRDWFERDIPCVFLADGRCSIYRVRPHACASYFVVSPPENCEPEAHEIGVRALGCLRLAAMDMIRFEHDLARMHGLRRDAYIDTLPRVVLRALVAWNRADWQAFVDRQGWPPL